MSKATHSRQAKNLTPSQRRDAQERKRDERAIRNGYRKQHKESSYLADDENFAGFATQLQTLGLELRDVPGDGNCLFRALGDQMDGHGRNHLIHRSRTVNYILEHRGDFEPFVEDDVPFDRHVENLAKPGTYAGNDSIVAFARRHSLNVVIHQLNAPHWRICGTERPDARELHIAYHNGDHYSSVRKFGDKSQDPTKFKSSDPKKKYGGSQSKQNYNADPCSASHDASASGGSATGGALASSCLDDMVSQIMDSTGCQESSLIAETLEDNQFDVEATIAFILQIMSDDLLPSEDAPGSQNPEGAVDNSLWSTAGTGSRIFGPVVGDVKKTQPNRTQASRGTGRGRRPQNGRNVRQQKRTEKKERQMERHKQKVLGVQTKNREDDDDNEDARSTMSVPVGQMGALSI